jgi:hypothetical protein
VLWLFYHGLLSAWCRTDQSGPHEGLRVPCLTKTKRPAGFAFFYAPGLSGGDGADLPVRPWQTFNPIDVDMFQRRFHGLIQRLVTLCTIQLCTEVRFRVSRRARTMQVFSPGPSSTCLLLCPFHPRSHTARPSLVFRKSACPSTFRQRASSLASAKPPGTIYVLSSWSFCEQNCCLRQSSAHGCSRS